MLNARAILEWYLDAGVDEAVASTPQNRFALKPAKPAAPKAPPLASKPVAPVKPDAAPAPTAPSAAMAQARELADTCDTLQALREAVEAFDGCAIKKTATNTVFADGNPQSDIMFIGEAPGAEEDRQGIPFCGPSGRLLDDMLRHIGLTRENFYISNTLFWRPPGNRNPTAEEIEICRPFVEKHVALIKPKIIVLVGGISAKTMLGVNQGITKLRGKEYAYNNQYLGQEAPAFALFHPSYLLRSPEQKKLAWQDLLDLQIRLAEKSREAA